MVGAEKHEDAVSGFSAGVRYMALGAFWFSVMSLLVKAAGERVPSQQIVLVRGVVTLALTYALLRRAGLPVRGSRERLLVLRGVLGFAALSCFYYALVHLPLADATVIQYTNPVWTALLAVWLLGERMLLREAGLVLASLLGVLLIARPDFLFGAAGSRLAPAAVGIALLGALFSAAAYVSVRKLAATEEPLVIVFYFTLVTVPAALPGTLIDAVWPTAWEWMALLGVGLAAQAGQVYMTLGLQRERAGRATAVGYLQIVFAALWGLLFYHEVPDGWGIAGALLIVGSTLLLGRGGAPVPSGSVAR